MEEQVRISNQNLIAADAQFRAAKAAVRIARACFTRWWPPRRPSPLHGRRRISLRAGRSGTSGVREIFPLPFNLSYTADLWGSIRRNILANAEMAQASAADLENARLLYQAELAEDYFELHGLDGAGRYWRTR